MKALDWALANKVKTGLSLIAALAAVVVLPLKIEAWAEDIAREQVLKAQGAEEAIHSRQEATHRYDFYSLRVEQTESELIYLEESEAAGEELTSTQKRKMRKLEEDLKKFEELQQEALDQLKALEHDHGTTE